MTVSTINLFDSFVRLQEGGRMRAERRGLGPQRDGWQLRTFRVETDTDVHADHWEIHSNADELVSCLTGGLRLCLRPERPGEEEEAITLTGGDAVIVPSGRWHRIELDAPSEIMSITLPHGSRLEKRSGA